MEVTVTEMVKMAGPFPICIKTEDGKWFNAEYFTVPDPHAGGSMGTVRVRDEKGRVKETCSPEQQRRRSGAHPAAGHVE
jgi:hypothetical protein